VLAAKELPLRFSGDTAKCFPPTLLYQAQGSVHSAPRNRDHSWFCTGRVDLVCCDQGLSPRDSKTCRNLAATIGLLDERSASQVLDFNRLHGIGQFEIEDLGIEVQLRFQHSLDILGFSKTVLLALESEMSDR